MSDKPQPIVRLHSIIENYEVRGVERAVVEVTPTHAVYFTGRRRAKVRLDRIFNDGKARTNGWFLVKF